MLLPEVLVQADLPAELLGTELAAVLRGVLGVDVAHMVTHGLRAVVDLRTPGTPVLATDIPAAGVCQLRLATSDCSWQSEVIQLESLVSQHVLHQMRRRDLLVVALLANRTELIVE